MVNSAKTLLIAGCDTDVGKTVVTSALAAHWHTHQNSPLGLMKLMQTGSGDDEQYQALFGHCPGWTVVTPLKFQAPLAPPLAAQQEGKTVDLVPVWQTLQSLQQHHDHVLVEALGSLGSPVTPEFTVADIAGLWRLDTLLVVPVKLGALGQAIAQVALARQAKVPLKALVLSCTDSDSEARIADWAPPEVLSQFTHLPVLGAIPYLSPGDRRTIPPLAQACTALDLAPLGYWAGTLVK